MAHTSRRMRRNARAMRHEPTISESRLWSWLRGRRWDGFEFKRQVPIGPYIVDFYCAELKLVIESDGAHHDSVWMWEYEGARTAYLQNRGLRVLRIPNTLLIHHPEIVEDQIRAAIGEKPPHPPSAPSPPPRAGEKE